MFKMDTASWIVLMLEKYLKVSNDEHAPDMTKVISAISAHGWIDDEVSLLQT